MAKYVATKSVTVYNTVEEAVAGIETAVHAVEAGTFANFKCGVIRTESNRYVGWYVYTNVA